MRRETWKAMAAMTACGLTLGACASMKPKSAPVVAAEPPPPPAVVAATPAPTPPPVIVKVPVPVKEACVPKSFPRTPPKYPDTDAALRDAGGAADRYQLMAAGRLLRERRLAELEKVVEGCR